MKFNVWSIVILIGFALSSILQTVILIAVFVKGGGTTGADPVLPIFPFVILVFAASVVSIWKRNSVPKAIYASALISGVFGSLLPFWLEYTGALVNYERAMIGGAYVLAQERIIFPLIIFGVVEGVLLTLGCWRNAFDSNS